jgi:hypothetical protein
MANVSSLAAWRNFKRTDVFIEETWHKAREQLADALSADISRMNGHQLRQLRDSIIGPKLMVFISSPEGRWRIGQKVEELGRELTQEEVAELVPPVTVSFV